MAEEAARYVDLLDKYGNILQYKGYRRQKLTGSLGHKIATFESVPSGFAIFGIRYTEGKDGFIMYDKTHGSGLPCYANGGDITIQE